MKKLYFAIAAAVLMLTACTSKKAQTDAPAQEDSFEVQQIKMGMNQHLDSLISIYLQCQPRGLYHTNGEGIELSAEEKMVKPDYLMNPAEIADKLDNLSMKYRALIIFQQDKVLSDLYEMEDVYTEPMTKLVTEINDPSIKFYIDNNGNKEIQDITAQVYKISEENGRSNYFWQATATGMIEDLYLMGQNQEKFLANMTDEDVEKLTFEIVVLVEAFADLAEYDPELLNIYNVIMPLQAIDAISVAQFREQLNGIKTEIAEARKALFL